MQNQIITNTKLILYGIVCTIKLSLSLHILLLPGANHLSCVSRNYCYRQRDEIVNVQGMIEDTHERWLDQEEEYMQGQREFYRTYNTI